MAIPRLHKSTIAIALVAAALLALIGIPGRITNIPSLSYGICEHGWPFVFLRRQIQFDHRQYVPSFHGDPLAQLPKFGIPWMGTDNWKFWQAVQVAGTPQRQFHVGRLIGNAVIALALLVAVTLAWEFRRRRRRSTFSFSIGDMFVMVGAMCVILGWVAHQRRSYSLEMTNVEQIANAPDSCLNSTDLESMAPLWARALFGRSQMPNFTLRVTLAGFYADKFQNADALRAEIASLPHLRTLWYSGPEERGKRFPFSVLSSANQVSTLIIENSQLDEADVHELAHLAQLRKISYVNYDNIAPEIQQQLHTALPNCEIVNGFDDW